MTDATKTLNDDCLTCTMTKARSGPLAPLWDNIIRTEHWDVVHSYNASIEGWLVLVTRNHRDAIADLTEDEAAELGTLTRAASVALGDITGCVKTYVAQFAENPDHRHVHFHVIAVAEDHPAELRGPRIFGALEGEPVSESIRHQLALDLRSHEAFSPWRA